MGTDAEVYQVAYNDGWRESTLSRKSTDLDVDLEAKGAVLHILLVMAMPREPAP